MKILKYFKTPLLKYFMKLVIFNIKWLKTFKNMIKVYQVSRRYIMLFMHNNKYLPLIGLFTLLQWTIHKAGKTSWNFWNISEIFHEIFHDIFQGKKFHEIYITNLNEQKNYDLNASIVRDTLAVVAVILL